VSEIDGVQEDAVEAALRRQADDPDDHDRGLIVERLGWSPQKRLDAHTAFLRFYVRVRPEGPLIQG
jgi:hypothetical protein